MSPTQFCTWLKGFIAASNHYNLTPEGWQQLKDTLNTVKLETSNPNYDYVATENHSNTLTKTKGLLHD